MGSKDEKHKSHKGYKKEQARARSDGSSSAAANIEYEPVNTEYDPADFAEYGDPPPYTAPAEGYGLQPMMSPTSAVTPQRPLLTQAPALHSASPVQQQSMGAAHMNVLSVVVPVYSMKFLSNFVSSGSVPVIPAVVWQSVLFIIGGTMVATLGTAVWVVVGRAIWRFKFEPFFPPVMQSESHIAP